MSELKAYSVQGYDSGCVVFALHDVVARREGANELNTDFESIDSCRRAPQFDEYAPGPVPIRALLEHGWYWECANCNRLINGMEVFDEDSDEPHEPAFHDNDQWVYCNEDCKASDLAERAQRKEAKANLIATFEKNFPGCTVERTWGCPVANALSFKFPGCLYGGRWEIETPGSVFISKADEDAWGEYRVMKGTVWLTT